MISKNIHQIWVGNKNPPFDIMQSWKNYCKKFNWNYFLWTENEIENLNLKNKKIYEYYKYNTNNIPIEYNYRAMSDVARLEIINQFGGYYLDCDLYSWNNDIEKFIDYNILSDLIDNLDEIHQKNLNIMWENYNMSIVNASWYTCGCWQLTHFSKKYPFVILPQNYIFSSIEYAYKKGKTYTDNIIASCIHDYDLSRLNNYLTF